MIRPHGDNASVDIVEEEVEDYENRTKDYRNAIYTIQYNDVHFDNNHTEEAGDKPGKGYEVRAIWEGHKFYSYNIFDLETKRVSRHKQWDPLKSFSSYET